MEEDTKKIIAAAVIAGVLFSVIILIPSMYILSIFTGLFAVWLYKRFGGRLTPNSFTKVVVLSVTLALLIGYTALIYSGILHTAAISVFSVFILLGMILVLSIFNLFVAHIGYHFIANGEERKALWNTKTMWTVKVLGWSIVFLLVIGVLLWQMPRSTPPSGTRSTGFGAVKPIDHTNDGGNLHLVVMNAVGSSVNINVTGVGVTRRDVGPIGGGDTQNVTWQ